MAAHQPPLVTGDWLQPRLGQAGLKARVRAEGAVKPSRGRLQRALTHGRVRVFALVAGA